MSARASNPRHLRSPQTANHEPCSRAFFSCKATDVKAALRAPFYDRSELPRTITLTARLGIRLARRGLSMNFTTRQRSARRMTGCELHHITRAVSALKYYGERS